MTDNFDNNDEFENSEPMDLTQDHEKDEFEQQDVPSQPFDAPSEEEAEPSYYSAPSPDASSRYAPQDQYGNSSYSNPTPYGNSNYQGNSGYNNQNYNYPNQNGSFRPYEFGGQNGNYSAPTGNYPPQNGKKKSSKGKKIAALIIVLAVCIGMFTAVRQLFPSGGKAPELQTSSTAESSQAVQKGDKNEAVAAASGADEVQFSTTKSSNVEQLSAIDVAKKARPSVVGVMTYKNSQLSGEGSGVVMGVDSSGEYTYIITCAHVINESGVTYGVRTLEGKNYTAEMVAADARTDIGVLRVDATNLPVAEFGDSSALQIGETVYAIGNPGGSEYFGSITNGIVSAIDRSVSGTYTMTCIQHNAAINPGNSGGALVNSAGQVIGINSSKIAATDYEGMGFAIPMSIVKSVVDDLIKYKYVPNRPKLGIEYASVDSYQLYSMVVAIKGLPTGSLVIAGISPDSTLAGTEAQVGDLIIAVNGKKMDTSDVLLDLINTGNVGDTLTLTLCRVENRTYKTTTFDVKITLVEDKGIKEETTTAAPNGDYYYGGASSFEDFFEDYFGSFGF